MMSPGLQFVEALDFLPSVKLGKRHPGRLCCKDSARHKPLWVHNWSGATNHCGPDKSLQQSPLASMSRQELRAASYPTAPFLCIL